MHENGKAPENEHAFDAPDINMLIDEHHASIYRYSFRLAGRQSEAEDVTQQTFLIALQKLDQLKNPRAAKSWLMTIARNCFLKRVRGKKSANASELDIDVEQIGESEPDEEADEFDPQALKKAVGELDEHHRIVIMMFYFEKLSYQAIADQLEVKIGTVMSRLSRAKTKLREAMLRQTCETKGGFNHG